MKYSKQIIKIILLFITVNLALLEVLLPVPAWAQLPLLFGCAVFYIGFHIRPKKAVGDSRRLRALIGGYEILLVSFWVILAETVFYAVLQAADVLARTPLAQLLGASSWMILAANLLIAAPLILFLLINGFFRVLMTSRYLRVLWRAMLLFLWWVPVFHIFLFYKVLKEVRREYYFERARLENEETHAENRDCATRYPIVMVHGIFFRDWQKLGYWGRIPKALTRCGAQIFYGGQQSSLAVKDSAEELAAHLREIMQQTGAEKLNIIAHSKGGLDSRYAISRLGMAPYAASLTTINTPHRGVIFGQILLRKLPQSLVHFIEERYNALFHVLGDTKPDFLGGVTDLTAERCETFNREVPDAEGVLYQSVMSYMKKSGSAGFPLNLTWRLVKKYDKELNDGLVARSSAPWGNFLGEVSVPHKRGISHGDMIDLMREDIDGFDVREFYIELVKDLKEKGL